jgi:hypothetical protein
MQSFQRLLGWATSIFGLNSILRGPVGHPRGKLQTRPRPVQCRVPEPANPRGEKLDPPPPPSGLKPAGFGFKPARLPSLIAEPTAVDAEGYNLPVIGRWEDHFEGRLPMVGDCGVGDLP